MRRARSASSPRETKIRGGCGRGACGPGSRGEGGRGTGRGGIGGRRAARLGGVGKGERPRAGDRRVLGLARDANAVDEEFPALKRGEGGAGQRDVEAVLVSQRVLACPVDRRLA